VAAKPIADIAAMPRPKILGETHGLIKLIADPRTGLILGATLFCVDSQELINLIALAMRASVPAVELRDGIWTHPSSTEALNEVLAALS
jgi:pyruvate/2-oxoglutarate dehydrogenase complex dihydrolipoamide dehydrogenase (E3) component